MNDTTLKHLLNTGAVPGRPVLLAVLGQVAEQLDRSDGMVHGNLTPADILVSEDAAGQVIARVSNFGIDRSVAEHLTSGEAPPEAAHYMSREQILGNPVDRRSDVFSLGVIAYELLCGRKPFQENTLPALFYEICTKDPPPADQLKPELGQSVPNILNRALAKNAEDRFASCGEFVGVLTIAIDRVDRQARQPKTMAAVVGGTPLNPSNPPLSPPSPPEKPQPPRSAILPPLPERRHRQRHYADDEPPKEERKPVPAGRRSAVRKFGVAAAIAIFLIGLAVFFLRPRPQAMLPSQVLDTTNAPVTPPPSAQPPPAVTPEPPPPEETPKPEPAKSPIAKPAAEGESVRLLSEPAGATITVDSERACITPCSLPLKNGRHTLSATLAGYDTARRIFNVPEDDTLVLPLNKPTGTLTLTSVPPGSLVAVDGQSYGHTPVTLHLAPGVHQLEIVNGGQHHSEAITIQRDTLQARSFNWQH